MPQEEKGARGKGRQPLSLPRHAMARSANGAPAFKRLNTACMASVCRRSERILDAAWLSSRLERQELFAETLR